MIRKMGDLPHHVEDIAQSLGYITRSSMVVAHPHMAALPPGRHEVSTES
jgi:hypothetical protein